MKHIEKYLNKFNLSILGVGMLAVAIFILISLRTALSAVGDDLSSLDIDDILTIFMSASSSLRTAFYLFILLLIAAVVIIAGSAFKYVYSREKSLCYVIYMFSGAVTAYTSIKILIFVSVARKLVAAGVQGGLAVLGGSFDADLLGLASNATGLIETGLALYGLVKYTLIGLIFMGAYAGYCIYSIKKHGSVYDDLFGHAEADVNGAEVFEAGMEKAKEAGMAIGKKTQEASESITEKIKGMTRKQKIGVVSVIAAIFIVFGGFKIYDAFFNFDKINLMEGMNQPTFSGYDGEGIVDDYPSMGDIDYDMTKSGMAEFLNDVTYTMDKTEGLSNGDEVIITALYSEATAKALKVKVTEDTMTVKVEGLTERFADGNAIPEKSVKKIGQVMDQYVEDNAKNLYSYYFDDEKTSCKRLDLIFARQENREYEWAGYDDKVLGIYQIAGEEETRYLVVSTDCEINSATDFDALGCEDGYLKSHFVYGMAQYLENNDEYILTTIGEAEKASKTLEDWYSSSLARAARIIYPITIYPSNWSWRDTWEVSVEENTVTYEYHYETTFDDDLVSDMKKSIKKTMDEEKADFKKIVSMFEEQSGIKDLTLKVKYVDEKGTVLYNKEFTK